MDQDNTKGQDKRNWRERLGIGAQGNKDLPRIADDFRKEATPAASRPAASIKVAPRVPVAAAPVRPAPMAPRANPKAIAPPSPVPADKLAERLRSQREASTRLAEQRVQVAKQRAEAQSAAPVPTAPPSHPIGGAKPKFAFAEDGEQAKPAPQAAKPAMPPIVPKPQITPARMPLGVPPPPTQQPNAFQPRPVQPAYVPPQVPSYPPQQTSAGYPGGYNPPPVPPYRPIDPATGMPSQGGYVPPRNFGVPPQPPSYQGGPRLNVPPRLPAGNQGGYGSQADYAPAGRSVRPDPRVAPLPTSDYENEFYDELPQQRGSRPTSTDYKQAYQEAEYGYEDEPKRSKAPWVLAGLLLLAIVIALAGAWWWMNYGKPMMSGQSGTQNVPAIAAPETPAKVQPEQPAAAAQQPATASPTKKQIYDRIVGDQEILGGEVTAPAETPAAIPEPTPAPTGDGAAQPSGSTGEDAAPLPIPPPPGGAGDQQGSLAPSDEKQSSEVITPAAGESQAAVAAQDLPVPPAPPGSPPAPGEIVQEVEKTRSLVPEPEAADSAVPVSAESEKIADTEPAPIKKKPAVPAKKVASKAAEQKLGSKPVVLVPAQPAKAAAPKSVAKAPLATGSDAAASGGLYGTEDITVPAAPAAQPAPAAPKKKKTLADLFANNDDEPANVADQAPPPAAAAPAKKPQAAVPAPAPAPVQVANGAGGFVVQLASFRSRDEASGEYSRLKAKHSQTLGRYSPVITEATVGGSTRYRLSVGRMESQAQASAVCSSLFAQGERDCLVKKQ